MELPQPATRNQTKLILRITLHYQYELSNGVAYLKWSYRNPIKLIFRITLHYQYELSNGVAYLKWSYCNLQPATQ